MNAKREMIEKCIKNYLNNEYDIEKEINQEEYLVETLGIDSLGILKMAIKVEEELGIVIPDEELASIGNFTYGEVIEFLAERYE